MSLVLVTGASGFIAKRTIRKLLEDGYRVRGTVRNETESTIAQNSVETSKADRFSLITADLLDDDNWDEAVRGCQYVLHIASPYPIKPPQDREALVPIARDGTLRVLKAALDEPSVERVVLVSSIVATMYRENRPRPVFHLTESDWTDPEWKLISSYSVSKTRAEKAAWDYVKQIGQENKLTVVNLGMVWGPLMDDTKCTTEEYCRFFLTGAYPAVPPVSMMIVDVRDVASVLVAAMKAPTTGGRRLICSAGNLSMAEIGSLLALKFPQYKKKIPTRSLPIFLAKFMAWFDPAVRNSLPDLETTSKVDSSYVTELTGVSFRSPEEAVVATAQSLIDLGIV